MRGAAYNVLCSWNRSVSLSSSIRRISPSLSPVSKTVSFSFFFSHSALCDQRSLSLFPFLPEREMNDQLWIGGSLSFMRVIIITNVCPRKAATVTALRGENQPHFASELCSKGILKLLNYNVTQAHLCQFFCLYITCFSHLLQSLLNEHVTSTTSGYYRSCRIWQQCSLLRMKSVPE